jgi:hypothetical protein
MVFILFIILLNKKYYGITFNNCEEFLKNCENYEFHKSVQKIKVIKSIIRSEPKVYI